MRVRVGSLTSQVDDVCVIAATNRGTGPMAISAGRLRLDLYSTGSPEASLQIPALRSITGAEGHLPARRAFPRSLHLRARHEVRRASPWPRVSTEARPILRRRPGNVRELENEIERAIVLGTTDSILPEDLPEAVLEAATPGAPHPLRYYEAVRELKKQFLLDVIEQAGGSYTEAAKQLGLHPPNLHRLAKNLGLKTDPGK